MISENLRIANLDRNTAIALGRVLDAVNGVDRLNVVPTESRVTVSFDESLTSLPHILAALGKAGYAAEPMPAADRPTSCCGGGCG